MIPLFPSLIDSLAYIISLTAIPFKYEVLLEVYSYLIAYNYKTLSTRRDNDINLYYRIRYTRPLLCTLFSRIMSLYQGLLIISGLYNATKYPLIIESLLVFI